MKIFRNAEVKPWVLVSVLALGLAIRLLIALDLSHFCALIDDSFYSLSIARSIAAGEGITCGGVPTNGFQPLFVFLSVPFYWLSNGSDAAIHMILAFMAVVSVTTGVLLYALLRKMDCGLGAVLGLVIWSFSPYVIRHGVNGLETPLTSFFLVLSGWYYVAKIRRAARVRASNVAVLGVILGFGVLSRIDMGLWAAALAVDFFLTGKRLPVARRFTMVLLMTFSACVVSSPWWLYSQFAFGGLMPTSGSAVRFISIAVGYNHWGDRSGCLPEAGIPLKYYALTLLESAKTICRNFDVLSTILTVRGMILIVLCGAAVMYRSLLRIARETPALILFPVLTVAAYSFWIFGPWFFSRYYYGLNTVLIIWICSVFKEAAGSWSSSRSAKAVILLAALGLILFAWDSIPQKILRRDYRSLSGYRRTAQAVMDTVPAEAAVGVFQSGALEYYIEGREVINLDGVVNASALDAMKNNEMAEYLAGNGIDWLIDWKWLIECLYVRRSGELEPMSGWALKRELGGMSFYHRIGDISVDN